MTKYKVIMRHKEDPSWSDEVMLDVSDDVDVDGSIGGPDGIIWDYFDSDHHYVDDIQDVGGNEK